MLDGLASLEKLPHELTQKAIERICDRLNASNYKYSADSRVEICVFQESSVYILYARVESKGSQR